MSTAEQIIAEVVRQHTPMHDNGPFGDDPWTGCAGKDCADWPGGDDEAFAAHVAAHVVAALTNAGHLLLDPDDVQRLRLVIGFTDSSDVTRVPMQALLQRLDELDVAAARVAEGGDQP